MENLTLPNEIVLQILGYLSLGELIQCARVSKRFNTICKDRSLSYSSSMSAIKDLTGKDRESIIAILIAKPEVKEVKISSINWKEETKLGQQFIYEAVGVWNSLGLFKKAIVKISNWKRARILGVSVTGKLLELYGKAGVLFIVFHFEVVDVNFLFVRFAVSTSLTTLCRDPTKWLLK